MKILVNPSLVVGDTYIYKYIYEPYIICLF